MSILTHCQNLDYAYIKGEGDVKKNLKCTQVKLNNHDLICFCISISVA